MAGMDFVSARQRVRKLIADRKPQELSRSALRPEKLRDNIIREEAAHTRRFRDAERNIPEVTYDHELEDGTKERRSYIWDTFPEIMRDVARAGFDTMGADMLKPEQVRASYQLNRSLLEEYLRTEEFQGSRPYTQGNSVESLFNAMASKESLAESARTRLAEHVARSQEMGEQEDAVQDADDMMERLRQQAKQDVADTGDVQDPTRRGIKQALKQAANAHQALGELLDQQAASTFAQDVRAAAQDAAAAGADAVTAISSLPGMEPGEARNLSADQQIELAEKWAANKEMLKVLEMLGRMFPAFRNARAARSTNVPIEPVGVTTGRHLERLLPSEIALAHADRLKPMFVKKWSEHSLLEYEMVGKEPTNKGPIITVVDGSGSMAGESFVWATSLALTLFKLSRREKRQFAGVEFGSAGQLKSWIFPAREPVDMDLVLDFASHFFGGGTSTVTGMRDALRIIREHREFDTADVVLIGDGNDTFSEADKRIRDELNGLGVRIHGLTIKTGANPYFQQMCEWHTDVLDLARAQDATSRLAHQIT